MTKPDLILPTNGNMNQPFGVNEQMYSQPMYGGLKGHNGCDFLAGHGWTIYASHDGFANYEIDAGGGHGVVITSKDRTFKSIYWHLCNFDDPRFISPVYGKVDMVVETGDVIGYADNTGVSNGNHLHWGCKFIKDGVTLNKDNGYLGAVNPMLYCNKYTPEQFQELKKKVSLYQQLIDIWTKIKNYGQTK